MFKIEKLTMMITEFLLLIVIAVVLFDTMPKHQDAYYGLSFLVLIAIVTIIALNTLICSIKNNNNEKENNHKGRLR